MTAVLQILNKLTKIPGRQTQGHRFIQISRSLLCTDQKISAEKSPENEEGEFLNSHQNQEDLEKKIQDPPPPPSNTGNTFTALLRKSAFIDIGDPVGKKVIGTIYKIVENDLYIDFGWKFPCVCKKPKDTDEIYYLGVDVVLRIKDLEVSTKFLGDEKFRSLLEADCVLLRPLKQSKKFKTSKTSERDSLQAEDSNDTELEKKEVESEILNSAPDILQDETRSSVEDSNKSSPVEK